MNQSFGEWYRRAKIQPRNEDLVARWKAIEAFIKQVDENKIAELIRRFVGLPSRRIEPMEAFSKELLSADAAFPTEDNEVEMQVLCGAALATILEKPSAIADCAALLLISAVAQGFRKPPILPDVVSLGRSYLFGRSAAVRILDTRHKLVGVKHEQLIEAVKASATSNSAAQMEKPLEAALRGLSEAINNVALFAEQSAQALERANGVLLEESNIVWWVFGEHSRDIEVPFPELPSGFAAIVAAKELADLTLMLPGPKAAPAYLDKQLDRHRNKKLKLVDLTAELRADWIMKLSPSEELLDLTPINFVISSVADGLDPSAATQLARRQLNLGSGLLDTLTISVQAYAEFLAMRAATRK
jgi:hypothetical protein